MLDFTYVGFIQTTIVNESGGSRESFNGNFLFGEELFE